MLQTLSKKLAQSVLICVADSSIGELNDGITEMVLDGGDLVASDMGNRDARVFWTGQGFSVMSTLNYVLALCTCPGGSGRTPASLSCS